jgi:hypothetical protein
LTKPRAEESIVSVDDVAVDPGIESLLPDDSELVLPGGGAASAVPFPPPSTG